MNSYAYNLLMEAIDRGLNNDYYKAIKIYEKLVNKYPGNYQIKLQYARTLVSKVKDERGFDLKSDSRARELFSELINTYLSLNAQYELGRLEHTVGNFKQAIINYETVISHYKCRSNKENVNSNIYIYSLCDLCSVYLNMGDLVNAERVLKLVYENGSRENYLVLKAKIYELNSDLYSASKIYSEIYNDSNSSINQKYRSLTASAKIDIYENRNDLAIEKLNNVVENTDGKIRLDGYKKLLFALVKNGEYEKAYNLFLDIQHLVRYLPKRFINQVSFYLKSELGILTDDDYSNMAYSSSLLVEYDENAVIEHILQRHQVEFYDKDFIRKNFDAIKEKALKTRVFDFDYLMEEHRLKIGTSLGTFHGNETDTLAVILYPNSSKIVTIYPDAKLITSDMKNEYSSNKCLKRESQIEKFNRKYQKK